MIRPDETFQEVIRRGTAAFKDLIQGATEVLRTGDTAMQELDDTLRGTSAATVERPEETFLAVLSMLQAAMEEARESGSASTAGVAQKAREALSRVTVAEPSWRSGPSMVRTASDVFRMALRDLRGSQSLIRLATGQGNRDDLAKLLEWTEGVQKRVEVAQQVVGQPRAAAPKSPPERPQEPKKPRKGAVAAAEPPKPPKAQAAAIFARSMGEVMGDAEVKRWAQQMAAGKMTEEQFIDRWGRKAGANPEELMRKAKDRSIENGLSPDDPYLKDM